MKPLLRLLRYVRPLVGTLVAAYLCMLLLALATSALADGLGIPTRRAGLGFGNLRDFTGLRINFREHDIDRMAGATVTLFFRA